VPDLDPIVIPGRDESRAAFESVKTSIKGTSSAIDELKGKFAGLAGSSSGNPVNALGGLAETVNKLRGMVGIPLLLIAGVTAGAIVAHKEVSALGQSAEDAGVKASKLSALQDKLKAVGGDAKDAANALKTLRQGADKGAGGEGEDATSLAELFKLNNVSLSDAAGKVKAINALYDDVAKMIMNAANNTDRLTIATLAFGSEAAPAMLKAIMAGATSFDTLGKKGGETLDAITSKAREFDNLLTRMSSDSDGLFTTMGNSIKSKALPAISLMYEGLAAVMALAGNKRAKETSFILGAQGAGEDARRLMGAADADAFYNSTGALRDPKTGLTNTTRVKSPPKADAKDPNDVDTFTRAQEQTTKRIALLNAETDTIGLNSEARERAKTVAELEEAAIRANSRAGLENTAVTEDQRLKINALADSMQAASLRSRQMRDAWDGLNDTVKYFGNTMVDALDVMTDKTKSWSDFTVSAARSVARELAKAALTGEGTFAKLLGMNSAGGGTGGLFGALLKVTGIGGSSGGEGVLAGGAALGQGGIGAMADGGVIPAGGLALVSEHSPGGGKFVRAGSEPITVTPGNVGSGGGDLHFTYAPTITGGSSDDIRAELQASEARVKASIVPMVREAQKRRMLS
jgi:hypothetical protein